MEQKKVVAIILGILVIISVIQAFQLSSLKSKMTEGKLSVKSPSASASTSSGSGSKPAALPASVKNLPQMVGGC